MAAATNGPVCGNCGAGITADAVTCPACGVLLAAYQTTGGSEAAIIDSPSGSAAFEPIPTDRPSMEATPPFLTAPFQRPTSMSPTSDANLRAHRQMQGDLHPNDVIPDLATGPDELSRMASGDDELADMADGEDELSAMAAGHDDLSAMASETGGSFEDEVNAELAGAKVVFSGGKPVIEAELVEVVDPGEGDPDVIEHPPGVQPPIAPAPATTPIQPQPRPSRPAPADRGRPQRQAPPVEVVDQPVARQPSRNAGSNPSRVPPAPSWQSLPGGAPTWLQDKPKPQMGKLVGAIMAIPFLLMVCLILGIGRGIGGFLLISLITLAIIVFLLVRAAGLTGRKTTSMPRDDSPKRR